MNITTIWKRPPKIKVYEALGCIADKRITVSGNNAKVYSSSKEKYYTVTYDPKTNAIMSNDNGSYWVGYLGYPAIAVLLLQKRIVYNEQIAMTLRGIRWKDINVRFKNDFSKTETHVLKIIQRRGHNPEEVVQEVNSIYDQLPELSLLGEKKKPPTGY